MKRFAETTIWSDPWFQDLHIKDKLLWSYLLSNCDNAGVWNTNLKLAEFQIGITIEWERSLTALEKNIIVLSNGRIWIPKFIGFQFGKLSSEAKVHQHVIGLLKQHGLSEAYESFLNSSEKQSHSNGIAMGYLSHKDKDKVKDKEKDRGECEGRFSKKRPANLDEVIAAGATSGIPPDVSKLFFDHWQSTGWIDKNSHEIQDWRSKLSVWWSTEKSKIEQQRQRDQRFSKDKPITKMDVTRSIMYADGRTERLES